MEHLYDFRYQVDLIPLCMAGSSSKEPGLKRSQGVKAYIMFSSSTGVRCDFHSTALEYTISQYSPALSPTCVIQPCSVSLPSISASSCPCHPVAIQQTRRHTFKTMIRQGTTSSLSPSQTPMELCQVLYGLRRAVRGWLVLLPLPKTQS